MEQILVDNKHEYDYKLEGDSHRLHYADNGDWQFPTELALEVVDDGDGLSIMEDGQQILYIQYTMAEKLTILLKMINRDIIYEVVTKKERI